MCRIGGSRVGLLSFCETWGRRSALARAVQGEQRTAMDQCNSNTLVALQASIAGFMASSNGKITVST